MIRVRPIQMSRDMAMSHRSQLDSGCRVQKRGSIAVCATVNAALALHASAPIHLWIGGLLVHQIDLDVS